ncbi:MAG: YceD family protein [Azoarcus sp.]|jgi:uncharacterized protein|nr:YceD family protein [Azoarcus sp.]
MSKQSIADVFRFAREARQLAGELPLAALGRLADQLARDDGALSWSLAGSLDVDDQVRLRLKIDGRMILRCLRCLGELEWPLAIDVVLSPVKVGEPPLLDDDDEVDEIEVGDGGELDVLALVEDEIILTLPFAPRHEEDCISLRPADGVEKESPFAALAARRR